MDTDSIHVLDSGSWCDPFDSYDLGDFLLSTSPDNQFSPLPELEDTCFQELYPGNEDELAAAEEILTSDCIFAVPSHNHNPLGLQNVSKRQRSESSEEGKGSSRESVPPQKKSRSIRFTKEQVKVLQAWLKDHKDDPYPEKSDKNCLANATGLTARQVEAWFTRARKRKLPYIENEKALFSSGVFCPTSSNTQLELIGSKVQVRRHPMRSDSPSSGHSSLAVMISTISARSINKAFDSDSWVSQGENKTRDIDGDGHSLSQSEGAFMQWWLSSLPMNKQDYSWEGMGPICSGGSGSSSNVPLSVASHPPPSPPSQGTLGAKPTYLNHFRALHKQRARKESLFAPKHAAPVVEYQQRSGVYAEDNCSDDFSLSTASIGTLSAYSTESAVSSCSYTSFGSRRGRRLPRRQHLDSSRRSEQDSESPSGRTKVPVYQCTFCRKPFNTAYKWMRHEKSIHAPQSIWVCKPFRASEIGGSADHEACWAKPLEERTFYRKDALVQHFESKLHNLGNAVKEIDLGIFEVRTSGQQFNLRCGFCGRENATWNDRVGHVAQHFRAGLDMSQWDKKVDPAVSEEPEQTHIRTLMYILKTLGLNHPVTLKAVGSLSKFWTDQGKTVEAEQIYQRALEGLGKTVGPDHILVLDMAINLGILYHDQYKLDKAEEMYQRVLLGREQALGPNHTSTLDTVNSLGVLYYGQFRLDKAEEMFLRALLGREQALGFDHTSTLDTVNNLGMLYRDQYKLDKAEEMFLRALVGREKILEPDHNSTLHIVNNLARLCFDQGKLDEAERVYSQTISCYQHILSVGKLSRGCVDRYAEVLCLSIRTNGTDPSVVRPKIACLIQLLRDEEREYIRIMKWLAKAMVFVKGDKNANMAYHYSIRVVDVDMDTDMDMNGSTALRSKVVIDAWLDEISNQYNVGFVEKQPC